MQKFYESFESINTLAPHAYYIPFGKREDVFDDRKTSDRFRLLSGENWKIKGYDSIFEVADDFYKENPEKKISVPSCVQFYGYDHMQYTNVNYPFPYDPPYTPNKNPAYHYRTNFDFSKDGDKAYLVFEGVDSCLYVYLNDKFVGFSQITHRVSEFDVTDFVKDGENKLDVLVLKWCAGSYFEDQDKLRFTGIIRDVYLLKRPDNHIVDYRIDGRADGSVTFALSGEKEEGNSAIVHFNGETKSVKSGETITFKVENPRLWSAEIPNLYDMIIESNGEFIGEKVGLRTVEVKNGLFLLNGKAIKLCGVNRHDAHPEKGSAVSLDDIKADLDMMKKLNVNAIRTSHYPSCPEFYKLCDERGFYVLSESDVECHGVITRLGSWKSYDFIAENPEFEKPILYREECNVKVNINRPCVVIWSLGNEAGYGINFDRASEYVKSLDGRPIHYERAVGIDKEKDNGDRYYNSPVDMVSPMYPSFEWIDEFFNDNREKRPLVLCEYAHAMGNGPGEIEKYWNLINSHDRFFGGFIWEWADHGILKDGKLLYGGDFGETLHDGNFCMDGILDSYHRPMDKTMEMKKVYQPILFDKTGDKITVKSRNYFRDINGKIDVLYRENGEKIDKEEFDLNLKPQEIFEIKVKPAQVIAVEVFDGDRVIAAEGFTDRTKVKLSDNKACDAKITESGRYIEVLAGETAFKFDKTDNALLSITKKGEELLKEPMRLNIWRAPTDNDMFIKSEWKNFRFFEMTPEVRNIKISDNKIAFCGKFTTVQLIPIGDYEVEFTFFKEGADIALSYNITNKDLPFLPRIGWRLAIDKSFDKVNYFGYGPYESYRDRKACCICDFYEDSVKNMEQNYIKPQENGNRTGCMIMSVSDGKTSLLFEGEDFEFSTLPHSIEDYSSVSHSWELKNQKFTNLCVDYFQSGLGTNSCGSLTSKEHRVPDRLSSNIKLTIK